LWRLWGADMELDRETLDRFVDGELPPKEMERVADMIAAHPEMEAYVRRQEALRHELRTQFHRLDAQMPEHLIQAVLTAPVSWQWRLREWQRRNLSIRVLAPAGGAMALGLIIGVALRPQGDLTTDVGGQLVAKGALARALDTQLASAGASGPTRIGISFRSKSGRDCRTFTEGENAGLACHQGQSWMVETLTRQPVEDQGAAYRMAGSGLPDAVRAAVSASIEGAPFDAQAEARARAHGWSGR
jgi:hypothetical protein